MDDWPLAMSYSWTLPNAKGPFLLASLRLIAQHVELSDPDIAAERRRVPRKSSILLSSCLDHCCVRIIIVVASFWLMAFAT